MGNRAGFNQENVSRQVVGERDLRASDAFHTFLTIIAISSLCITWANLAVIN